jgi:PDZ domain-containing secreted protein
VFWLAWVLLTAGLSRAPGGVAVAFALAALLVGAIGVRMVVRPFRAVVVTADGLRLNHRLHRWADVEHLELAGSEAEPTLRLRTRTRPRRVSSIGQRLVAGSLAAVASEAATAHGVTLVDHRRPTPAWARIAWGVGLLVVAAGVIPVSAELLVPGVWVRAPGRTLDAHDRLRPAGDRPARGEVVILSVRDRPASVLDLVAAVSEDTTDLSWYDPLHPPEGSALDAADDASAANAAIAAGLACAGRPVTVTNGGVEVASVSASGLAATRVHRHERVVSVAGEPVRFKEDVYATLVGWDLAVPVPVVLEDARGAVRTEELEVTRADDGDQVLRGVHLRRRAITLDGQPAGLSYDFRDLAGDSSGLAAAVTIVDTQAPAPLVAPGTRVAMTGSISPDGLVGPIGGIEYKMVAARRARASVVLVPASQFEGAMEAADGKLQVVGVRTLDEAVVALGGAGCH